ncbi:hypothetical protein [Marinobacter salarius]|jgi:hypothetical protein|uniref:hypothetical protein n=1 Tax=Marinobacter salarius TaxID=1420917 RepID=UPI0010A9E552|nr:MULTISPECIES: hypothetical protein [Marinobacter]MBJ7302491.1 hypothetical protein [Marinobacter salarius]HIO30758.1 hypothetical protein [Marinobacter salarius]HIP01743.1 hypothetical protein [Marinobacter salarius]
MNTSEIQRQARILWLKAHIEYRRMCMDSEAGVTRTWKRHARAHTALCRLRAQLLTDDERRAIERREGLV